MKKKILSILICGTLLLSLGFPKGVYATSQALPANTLEPETVSPSLETEKNEVTDDSASIEEETKILEKSENEKASVTPYVLVEKSLLLASESQNMAVLLDGLSGSITHAVLVGKSPSGDDFSLPTHIMNQNAAVFSYQFTGEDELGLYRFSSIEVTVDGEEKIFSFADYEISVEFEVLENFDDIKMENQKEDDDIKDRQGLTMELVESDEEGNKNVHTDIEEALQDAGVVKAEGDKEDTLSAQQNMVIYVDAGHDSQHAGARGNGLNEEDVVLQIAKYVREELEQYPGVTVYMSRNSQACPYPGTTAAQDNAKRVDDAAAKGADVYVSLHCNASTSATPRGALVFAPNNNYNPLVGSQGQKLGEKVLGELTALGLPISWSGVVIYNSQNGGKYPDGSEADYYQIPRLSKLKGFPGIIVEHAFITNAYDAANYLSSDASLRRLAHADVEGIVKYYGLSKTPYRLTANQSSPRGLGARIQLQAQGFPAGSKYQFLATADVGKTWQELRGYGEENTIEWIPASKGAYMLCVRAKLPDNTSAEGWIGHYSIVEPEVSIKSLSFVQKEDLSMDLSAEIETNGGSLDYQYEVRKKENLSVWQIVGAFSKKQTLNFRPDEFGDYVGKLQVRTLTGKIITKEVDFQIKDQAQIIDFLASPKEPASVGDRILLEGKVNAYSNSDLQYDFMEYNGETWSYIKAGEKNTRVTWIPKKPGLHGLCIQVRNEKNQVLDKRVINYQVERDVNEPKILSFSSNLPSPQRLGRGIALKGEVFNPQNRPLVYEYLVYDGNTWKKIASSSQQGSIEWKPQNAGGYLLCYQIIDKEGKVSQKFLTYDIRKEDLKINALHVSKEKAGEYRIETLMNIEEAGLTYTYLDYSYTKNKWSVIKDFGKESSIIWNPDISGTHLILVRVKDENGKVYESDEGLNVESDMRLIYFAPNKKSPQAVGDEITLQAYVSTSLKEKINYKYLVYNQENWMELGSGANKTEQVWKPIKSGKYWLCLQWVDASGQMQQNIFEYEIEKPTVTINQIRLVEAKDKAYVFDADVTVKGAGIKYSYSVYDVANQQWISLSKEKAEKKITYFPQKEGYYWICLEAKFDNEKAINKIEEFHVSSPQIQSFQTQDATVQPVGAVITLIGKPVFEGRRDLQEQYLLHKVGDGNRWKALLLSDDKKSAKWKADEKGDYWICYQVTNGMGRIEQKIISFTIR